MAVVFAAFGRVLDGFAQIRHASQNGTEGKKMRVGGVGDHLGDGGFARAWGTVEDDGAEKAVCLDGTAQKRVFADDVILPDDLIERLRTHAGGKRRVGG